MPKRKGIFSRSRSPVKDTSTTDHRNGSFFGRRSRLSDDSVSSQVHKDSSIVAARQKVTDAQSAEKAADKALNEARHAVKEATQHVRRLEKEIAEE